jgi:hypothetical protein
VKRFLFGVGIGVGFVLGSRAGRGPYNQIEAKVKEIAGKPGVRDVVGQVSGAVKEQTDAAKEKVMEKLPSASASASAARSNGSNQPASSGSRS